MSSVCWVALFTFNSFYHMIAICYLQSVTCYLSLAFCYLLSVTCYIYLLYDAFYLKLAITCKNLYPFACCCMSPNFFSLSAVRSQEVCRRRSVIKLWNCIQIYWAKMIYRIPPLLLNKRRQAGTELGQPQVGLDFTFLYFFL